MGKLFEIMILKRLTWISRQNDWICDAQHGFTEGKSTETACHSLAKWVEDGFSRKEFTGAIFLDIAGAFDNAWNPAIISSLLTKRCPLQLVKLISSYLTNRKAILRVGRLRKMRAVKLGCPQGGVLSPLLWNILIDDILRATFNFPFKIIAYADDIVILVSGQDIGKLVESLQLICDVIIARLKDILLDVNASKCEFMVFSKRSPKSQNSSITVNGVPIMPSNCTKYLGFTIDASLSWRPHIQQRCELAAQMTYALNRYLSLTWGVNTRNLKILYKCVFMPTLMYGCSVWVAATRYKWCVNKLRSVQRKMTKCIARAFRSVSSEALLTITNMIPVELMMLEVTCSSFLRLKGFEFSPTALDRIKPLLEKLPCSEIDSMSIWHNPLLPPWEIDSPNITDFNTLSIYTDGSKGDNGVGAAAWLTSSSVSLSLAWKLPNHTTVLQSELIAILLSLKHIAESNDRQSSITFFSDSKVAIRQIVEHNKKICSITRGIKELISASQCSVRFEWVRSHSKCHGNNLADQLAKQAAGSDSIGGLTRVQLCFYEAKKLVKEMVNKMWETEWACSEKGALTHEFFPLPCNARTISNMYIHHEITQSLTGHSILNNHLAKINAVSSPACRCGFHTEDIHHLIFSCHLFDAPRISLKSSLAFLNVSFPCSLSEFASTREAWAAFETFVLATKRLCVAENPGRAINAC